MNYEIGAAGKMDFITKKEYDYIIHCPTKSNIGNYMMKYMAAVRISSMIPRAQFSNYAMPEWGITFPDISTNQEPRSEFRQEMYLEPLKIEYFVRSGVRVISLHGHLQRLENFPPVERARGLFRINEQIGTEFGEDYIVCPIRGNEILRAPHPGYTLIPIEFYKEVLDKEPGRPVFMGQTDPNSYTDRLRHEFPNALFLQSQGQFADFQTIYRAQRIVLPVSTFAWLAAWLSNASKIIMPIFGLYDYRVFKEHDLVPAFDGRFEFYRFPVQMAVPLPQVAEAHKAIIGQWHHEPARNLMRL